MVPACVVRNFTPISIPTLSGSAASAGVAVLGQIVHGQPLLLAAAVVKVQLTAVIVLFARSLVPETLAVYVVEAASAALGVNVAFRLVES